MKRTLQSAFVVVGASGALGAQRAALALPKRAPTVDHILSLKRAASPQISPDGRWVAYTVRETNWDDNAYETQIWLADAAGRGTRQLTHAKKSSPAPPWAPDGAELAFISHRTPKSPPYLIKPPAGADDTLSPLPGRINPVRLS